MGQESDEEWPISPSKVFPTKILARLEYMRAVGLSNFNQERRRYQLQRN